MLRSFTCHNWCWFKTSKDPLMILELENRDLRIKWKLKIRPFHFGHPVNWTLLKFSFSRLRTKVIAIFDHFSLLCQIVGWVCYWLPLRSSVKVMKHIIMIWATKKFASFNWQIRMHSDLMIFVANVRGFWSFDSTTRQSIFHEKFSHQQRNNTFGNKKELS